jgi:hypothetical protein
MSAGEQLSAGNLTKDAEVVEQHHVEVIPDATRSWPYYYLVKRGRYDVASFFTPNGT